MLKPTHTTPRSSYSSGSASTAITYAAHQLRAFLSGDGASECGKGGALQRWLHMNVM
jgi:hypothetical protein